MQLSVFEMIKHGVSTTIDIVDAFAREQINAKQNITDNNLSTTAKTIVGAINEHESDILEINRDLTPIYFQLISSGEAVNIEQQDCWCQENRVHIAFSATSNIAMPNDYIWGIVPNEYRPTSTENIGFVYIENISNIYINSVKVENNGYVHQTYASSVPANTRVTFIADYFI